MSSRSLLLGLMFFFQSCLEFLSPRLGKRHLVHMYLCFSCICKLVYLCILFLSSSLCQVLAAACDCGYPWTFHLTFCKTT